MLSNTAETKPRPNVVCHDGGGQPLDRHQRRGEHQRQQERRALERRRRHPSRAGGSAAIRIAAHTATPPTDRRRASGRTLTATLATTAAARIDATIPTAPSRSGCRADPGAIIGACACCWARPEAADDQRRHRGDVRVHDVERRRRRRSTSSSSSCRRPRCPSRRRSRRRRSPRGSRCAPAGTASAPSRRRSAPRRCCRGTTRARRRSTSRTKALPASAARAAGAGTPLCSKCREQREAEQQAGRGWRAITHSCDEVRGQAGQTRPLAERAGQHLVGVITARPPSATRSVW